MYKDSESIWILSEIDLCEWKRNVLKSAHTTNLLCDPDHVS